MWVVISFCDKAAEKFIRLIRGDYIVRGASHCLDRFSLGITAALDAALSCKSKGSYERALDEDSDRDGPPDIARARKFRRMYILPRRRLVRRGDGEFHWEQLVAGEDTTGSRTYQECDTTLSSLTEFGDGWVLYFWTLKMTGFVCLLAVLAMAGSWHDMDERNAELRNRDSKGALDWILARLGSARCTQHVSVCLDSSCSRIGTRHDCPAPEPINAICALAAATLFAVFTINLRWQNSEASRYVNVMESNTGPRTEDFSVMVENPPEDAADPDEWRNFFKHWGPVAYVTVAKGDGDLVWKCLEPRLLMLLLYKDNPNCTKDYISVLQDPEDVAENMDPPHGTAGGKRRGSRVGSDDVVYRLAMKWRDKSIGKSGNRDSNGADDEDAVIIEGDTDARNGLVKMVPWYTGGHLRLSPDIITMAAALRAESIARALDNDREADRSAGAVRLMTMHDPFQRYRSPYITYRWAVFMLKQSLPHYFGSLRAIDRDMVAQRLLKECPLELTDELNKLLSKEKTNKVVRIFVVFEQLAARRACLEAMTSGGLLPKYLNPHNATALPDECKFRGELALVITEPPAPEQIIWWNLRVGLGQRFKEECFSLFATSMLIVVSYTFAIAVQADPETQEADKNASKYLRSFGFACWAQIYNQMCSKTFDWLSSQEHHHDEDAKQLALLLRYTLLKCVNSIIFIIATPREFMLVRWNIAAMKSMLYADAVVGPFIRYIDPFSMLRRFLSRFLPNQPLMCWAHLSPAHDIAENYSNLIKSVFLGLYVLSLVPSSPLLTALACLTSYWVPTATLFVFRSAQNVDKNGLCRAWSALSLSKPAKYTAGAAQNLLGIALIASMMHTLQLYKYWPFDNLCLREGAVESMAWQQAGALGPEIWGACREGNSRWMFVLDYSQSVALWVSPRPWMSPGHARALRIYSIGSVIIATTLAVYFWGSFALGLIRHLFVKKVVLHFDNEESLPSFSGGEANSAYIPIVKDGSFIFPLLATDVSNVESRHIPWKCRYDLHNLTRDIGDEATSKGLTTSFSTIKYYGSTEM